MATVTLLLFFIWLSCPLLDTINGVEDEGKLSEPLSALCSDIAQLLSGFAILAGLVIAAWRVSVTFDGQVTDRFGRAVDQLSSSEITTRLAGISALGRIARGSPKDQPMVMDTLCAFIRQRSYRKPKDKDWCPPTLLAHPEPYTLDTLTHETWSAIRVIGNRDEKVDSKDIRLDLQGVKLKYAHLIDLNFQGVNFERANFSQSSLDASRPFTLWQELSRRFGRKRKVGPVYKGNNFNEACLVRASFKDANISDANFSKAKVAKADFERCQFTRVNLSSAIGSPESFRDASFVRCDLNSVEFDPVKLSKAKSIDEHTRNTLSDDQKRILENSMQEKRESNFRARMSGLWQPPFRYYPVCSTCLSKGVIVNL
jgi:uncharacterized protein YjbI with pentapeptide repeats